MKERLIDANKLNRRSINCANYPMNFIDAAPTVETITKNEYEARVKTEMVVMLEELKKTLKIRSITYLYITNV